MTDVWFPAVEEFPAFSEIAHYYQGIAILEQNGKLTGKQRAKPVLKQARVLLESLRSRVVSRSQMLKSVNAMGRCSRSNVNHFAKQNEGDAQCLSKHIQAIDLTVGSREITADDFNVPQADGLQEKLLEEIRQLP